MEKILIGVVIHDRWGNLKRWVDSWKVSEQLGATLVIIHNNDENAEWRSYCEKNGVVYIPRENIGFDTGPFQDIVMGRICQDINWSIILWCTDDIFPMRKTFLKEYISILNLPYVGIACMEISDVITTHVRTGGFMIRKEVANKLCFVANNITTKEECYYFEHAGGKDTLTMQVLKMGLRILPITPDLKLSPVWDSHVRSYLDRWEEYYTKFPINSKL